MSFKLQESVCFIPVTFRYITLVSVATTLKAKTKKKKKNP